MSEEKIPKGWKKVKLAAECIFERGIEPGTKNYNTEGRGRRFIRVNDLTESREEIIFTEFKTDKILIEKDIAMSFDGTIGIVKRGLNGVYSAGIRKVYFKNREYSNDFLFYLLQDVRIHKIISLYASGSTIKHAGSAIPHLEVEIPSSPLEQQKIADILSKVDEAIEQIEKIIAKHERIKKGLMQVLFTKGIDENGNIRSEKTHKFKDSPLGRIPEEWEVVELGNKEYFELKTGGTPSTERLEYWENGTVNWLSSGEVHKKRIYYTERKITEKGYKYSNATFIPIKSTLIALAGQGKTRGTAAINEIELTTNQSVAAIIPNFSKICPYYLYHYIDNQYLTLRTISAGAGRAGLSLTILSKFNIKLPEIKEQERIANIFEKIDNTIEQESQNLAKLKNLKEGLMQDLLTGKVRVNHLIEENENINKVGKAEVIKC